MYRENVGRGGCQTTINVCNVDGRENIEKDKKKD